MTTKKNAHKTKPATRPPCAVMTASAAQHADCAALEALRTAGFEVVVVGDHDIQRVLGIIEDLRKSKDAR